MQINFFSHMSHHVFLVWGRPSMTSPILWEKHPKSTIHVLFPVLSQNLSVICTNLEKTFTTFTFEYKDSNLRLILQVFISFFILATHISMTFNIFWTWKKIFPLTNIHTIFLNFNNKLQKYIHGRWELLHTYSKSEFRNLTVHPMFLKS